MRFPFVHPPCDRKEVGRLSHPSKATGEVANEELDKKAGSDNTAFNSPMAETASLANPLIKPNTATIYEIRCMFRSQTEKRVAQNIGYTCGLFLAQSNTSEVVHSVFN